MTNRSRRSGAAISGLARAIVTGRRGLAVMAANSDDRTPTGSGAGLALMKRGQNVGYQGYLVLFPATGQGLVVLTNSDNGTSPKP